MVLSRKFSFTLISANNLVNVRKVGSMKVYVIISLRGDSETRRVTQADKKGETNPKWNYSDSYNLEEEKLQQGGSSSTYILDFELYTERSLLGEKYVGQVNINLDELLEKSPSQTVEYAVKTGDGEETNGKLKFDYSFGEPAEFVVNDKKIPNHKGANNSHGGFKAKAAAAAAAVGLALVGGTASGVGEGLVDDDDDDA